MKPTFSLPPLSTYPSLSFSPSSNRRAFGGEERRAQCGGGEAGVVRVGGRQESHASHI